jgi:uncharacterized membrane protein YbaN (DUF454 family)
MNLETNLKANSETKDDVGDVIKRGLFFLLGTIFLILGGVGVLLPILPTTPFLLLSAACYYKSSRHMHNWMFHNRWFGGYIRNYSEGKGISLNAKLFTISLLWALILYSTFIVVNNWVVQLALLTIAIGVTIHLIKLPTLS